MNRPFFFPVFIQIEKDDSSTGNDELPTEVCKGGGGWECASTCVSI